MRVLSHVVWSTWISNLFMEFRLAFPRLCSRPWILADGVWTVHPENERMRTEISHGSLQWAEHKKYNYLYITTPGPTYFHSFRSYTTPSYSYKSFSLPPSLCQFRPPSLPFSLPPCLSTSLPPSLSPSLSFSFPPSLPPSLSVSLLSSLPPCLPSSPPPSPSISPPSFLLSLYPSFRPSSLPSTNSTLPPSLNLQK